MAKRLVIKKALYIAGFIFLVIVSSLRLSAQDYHTTYKAEGTTIVGQNTGRYNNRPLYINNTNAFVLTGDQPIARLVKDQYLYGTFMLAVERGGKAKWLQQAGQITSGYNTGQMTWTISDKEFPGLQVTLDILPMATNTGMAVRATAKGVKKGDNLIWAFGGAQWRKDQNLSWNLDVMGQPELLTWGFVPEEGKNNVVEIKDEGFFVRLPDSNSTPNTLFTVVGNCSAPTQVNVGEASAWNNAASFRQSKSLDLPLLNGTIAIENGKTIYWAFEAFNKVDNPGLLLVNNPEKVFADGLKRIDSFKSRVKIITPDPFLNAIAQASVAAVDGTWYPPVFVHGALQWNRRYPGWRTIFGGTMYGWHDRVRDQAQFYTEAQIKDSDKKEAKADPALLLTAQHPDSRFYGVGRINKDQDFYNMQSQFFDQIVEEYRWTADPDLVKFFRESLELHLIWIRDCFDPDGDGVYESYINLWPTDSQWYNGGGSAEETSYAYRGHLAAKDMARNAGDEAAEKYHVQMLEKIKKGFFDKMWISKKGHSGAYREQGGHERLHENPWLYSIFLPIDAGLTTPVQSIESVYYSEWALQNDRMSSGGRQVWTSNWIPAIWSVRELWPGDNYHLALSYFQAGLPNDGYDIFRGTFMRTAFEHLSPGNLGGIQGGVDFGDCVHTFARTLVSGLFGYHPDYPNGKVQLAPQFPSDWNNAFIELPDVKIAFERKENKNSFIVELARKAKLELLLPIQSTEIKNVTVNGEKVKWELLPAVGLSLVKIELAHSNKAEVIIKTGKTLPYYAPVVLEGNIGDFLKIQAKNTRIISVEDPQGVLSEVNLENGKLSGKLTNNKGYHTIIAQTVAGKAPQNRVFRIKINDPVGDSKEADRYVNEVPKNIDWENISVSSLFNADVTTIYQQQYLSPRPNTVSARLGSDGYSPWTFPYWKSLPPTLQIDKLEHLLDSQNQLLTPQGVPFNWNGDANNIAFTSMWDNYPKKIDFPVNKTGDAIYFLVSGSTNVMQNQIANAVIHLNYADGITDSLELIPPVNYWNLSTIDSHATAPGQDSRTDYTSKVDQFCMPDIFPEIVNLGENCRAMLLNLKMRKNVELKSVTLETLSQEVVVGLMGITIMK